MRGRIPIRKNQRFQKQEKRKPPTEKTIVEQLRAQNRKLEKENKKLKSQQKSLKRALEKTLSRVEDLTEFQSLEYILQEVEDGEEENEETTEH